MKLRWPRSLKRRLIAQLLLFQIGILLLFGILIVAFLVRADEGDALVDPTIAEIVAQAIERGSDGTLKLTETEALAQLRRDAPELWFIARNDRGEMVNSGPVPDVYFALAAHLDKITFADIRDVAPRFSHSAIIRRASGPAGEFTVLGRGNLNSMLFIIFLLSNLLMIPIFVILVAITIVAVPWIVSRAFANLSAIARDAGTIDIDQRGYQLPQEGIPSEVQPLVLAINAALKRLDEGYERHQRFILDAAHELRTPLAILQTRMETLPDGPIRSRLMADSGRIAVLAEQLLDLQRIDANGRTFASVDLVELCRGVAADLAPLAIAQGYELSFEPEARSLVIEGDAGALERAITNIIQNAIEHSGNRGTISIRVEPGGTVDISDQGPGIPTGERERIFEAFYRLQPKERGVGLGLNMVREILQRHGAMIAVLDAAGGGACFRLSFPTAR